jgi:hypothetical protein
MVKALLLTAALTAAGAIGAAGATYTYIGQIGMATVTIAWGTLGTPGNTIGFDSKPMGKAVVKVGNRTVQSDRNWAEVTGLSPDTAYDYEVQVDGKKIGDGKVRTYPEKAERLVFFVIGDFGTGGAGQRSVAEAMQKEFERRATTRDPVRFVLTVGDNIYSDFRLGGYARNSGDEDRHWSSKFFEPYKEIIRQIPFRPTIGNHDGNGSENRADLAVYLDNFFFPDNRPARWYSFGFANIAEFYALDSSDNSDEGHRRPVYLEDGDQFMWLRKRLAESKAPWKIPYYHHPLFNAGPRHPGMLTELKHWADLFGRSGVKVAFNGHEHNFQYSEISEATRGVRHVTTGAGGELRSGNITRRLAAAHIEGFAPQRHFTVAEIDGKTMKLTPISTEKVVVRGRDGREIGMPLVITLQ